MKFSKNIFTLLFIIFLTMVIVSFCFNGIKHTNVEGYTISDYFRHMTSKKSYGIK